MTKIRALIVDDEANNRENLRLALETYCQEVEVIAEADSAITAIDRIKERSPIWYSWTLPCPWAAALIC